MADEKSDVAPIGAPKDEDSRIHELDKRLEAAREREEKRSGQKSPESDASYRAGNRVLADLVGGMVGGAFLGWVVDQFAGTRPWGLLVLLFAGVGVAFRNIIRMSKPAP